MRNFADQKGLARNIQSHEKQGPIAKISVPSKAIFGIEGQVKSFPDKKTTTPKQKPKESSSPNHYYMKY